MIDLYDFTKQIFTWCENQNIPIVMARPKYNSNDFKNTDLDLIIEEKNIPRVILWLKQNNYKIICQYERSDGVTCHLYKNDYQFFHIDFISSLEIKGIGYLTVHEIMSRQIKMEGINYPDPIDQALILVMTHLVKHQNQEKFFYYQEFLKNIFKDYPVVLENRLTAILGKECGLNLIDNLKLGKLPTISFWSFVYQAWKTNGIISVLSMPIYYFKEIKRRFSIKKYKIVFLGIDGAGKTSIIHRLEQTMQDAFPLIKHCHFLPALPWHRESNSFIIQDAPHAKTERSYAASQLKLVYFFFRYWLTNFYPVKKPVLYLYDRYLYDLVVDPLRFRYKGLKKEKLLNIFKFYPKPDLCFIIDVEPEIALQRKQEMSLSEAKRQTIEYRDLKQKIDNVIIIKNEFSPEKINLLIMEIVLKELVIFNDRKS